MPVIIPPGGFAGYAQQTPASQLMFSKAAGARGGRTTQRRRRRARVTAAASRRSASTRRRRRSNGKARLVKGSAAAKRYMARIRKMRKR